MQKETIMKGTESQKTILHEKGICVIIPTYNNDGTVGDVIRDTLLYCDDVIVVDDGSNDNTESILSDISNITIVMHKRNCGKGCALKSGFRKALDLGFSFAITLDADGQHYPFFINSFVQTLIDNPGSLIVGERNLKGADRSFGSKFANRFSDFWFYIQTGRLLKDTQTGYRLYPIKKMKGLCLLTSRYEAELELLVFSSWNGIKICTVPIDVFYPSREERVSHFRPGVDFARISILNFFLCILAVIYGLPMRLWRNFMIFARTSYSLLTFSFFSFTFFTPMSWLYVKMGKMTDKKKYNIHVLIYRIARFITLTHGIPGVKFSFKKDERVNFDKPSVIICNHQSHLDLMCQLIFTPKIIFLTNDWVWKNPFYGVLIRNADYYKVSDGIDTILPKLRNVVERGYSIAVFPEGTRSRTCKIGRFHKGAFYIAKQLGIGITPFYLYGAGRVLKKGTYHLCKGKIHIEADPTIGQKELSAIGDLRSQASYFHKLYIKRCNELSNKIEQDV